MSDPRRSIRRFALCLVALSVGSAVLVGQGRAEQERQREQWQRVSDIFHAMGVHPGAVVADIGAGDGFFTSRLADAVGPSGRVLAVDVDDAQLGRLRQRLGEQSHRNVTVIKGTNMDPLLPPGTLDAALIVNAYHEMAEHQAMLQAIRTALKPTGRLVIVEPISDKWRAASRVDQVPQHEIAPEFVLQDVRSAGFRIIGLEDPFTTRGQDLEWMMTVTPGAATTTVASAAPSSNDDPTADWRAPALRISIDELVKLTGSAGATIIDVRDEAAFAKGHIPNALLVPLESVETSAARLRGLKRPFVTYCS
jgi:predicted methyltransferase